MTIRNLPVLAALMLLCVGSIMIAQDSVAGSVEAADYVIGPEDVLEISVWKEETLQREVLVRPDGKLSFPLIGDIHAAGKTPDQLRAEIAGWLRKYIPDPVVTVLVTKVVAYKVFVIGQVKKSGQYTVGRYLDVMQALALAGGLTPFASEDKIKVFRRQDGKEVVIDFDFEQVKRGRNLDQNFVLQSGDVIVVP